MWFAIHDETQQMAGTIALGGALPRCNTERETSEVRRASVQWLMVAAEHRRHGLASWLLAELEADAWRRGIRTLELETLATWHAAVAFYRAAGYSPPAAPASGGSGA